MRYLVFIAFLLFLCLQSNTVGYVDAQETGSTIIPDEEVRGSLTYDDSLDTYHVDFQTPGMYKILAQGPVEAIGVDLRVYQQGRIFTVDWFYDLGSMLIPIMENGEFSLNRYYQLAIYSRGTPEPDEVRDYVVSVVKLPGNETIQPNEEFEFSMGSGDGYMFSLDTREQTDTCYEMKIDTQGPHQIDWNIYRHDGLLMIEGATYNDRNYTVDLDPDLYHIFVENSFSTTHMTTFEFWSSMSYEITPGTNMQFYLQEGDQKNIIIPMSYGKQSQIDIQFDGDFWGSTSLFFGASSSAQTVTNLNLGYGDYLNISNIVVIPSRLWANIKFPAAEYERNVVLSDYSTFLHHNYKLLLICNSIQGNGSISVHFHELDEIPTLTPDNTVSVYFERGKPLAFSCIRIANIQSLSLCKMLINQTDDDEVNNIQVEPSLYARSDWNQGYLYTSRMYYSGEARELMDQRYYEQYRLFGGKLGVNLVGREEFFVQNEGDIWMTLFLEDGIYGGIISPIDMAGEVSLSIENIPSQYIGIGESVMFSKTSEQESFVFHTAFLSGHTYRIKIEYPSFSSYSGFEIYNSTGHILETTDDHYYDDTSSSDNVKAGIYYSPITQDISLLVNIYGDGELILTIEDLSYGNGPLYISVGLGFALLAGVGIGVYASKKGFV